MRPAYAKVLRAVHDAVQHGNFGTATPQQHRNILRIGDQKHTIFFPSYRYVDFNSKGPR